MKKINGLNKIFNRSIKQTRSRYISLFCIVLLGASFFAGLRNSPATMRTSMNDYFVKHHFADLTLISTLGFTEEDLKYINSLDETKEVRGSYRADFVMHDHSSTNYNVIAHSLNGYFNGYEVVEGRDVQNENEALIDKKYGTTDMIGKTYTLENNYGSCEVKVVGIIDSVEYIVGYLKGTNSYSNQANDGFIFISDEKIKNCIFPQEIYDLTKEESLYNEILLSYNIDDLPSIFDEKYDSVTKLTKISIEDAVNTRLRQRRTEMIESLQEELEEPMQQYEDGLKEYLEGKEQYDLQIADAKMKIIDGKLQLLNYTSSAMSQISGINQYQSEINGKIETIQSQLQEIKDYIHNPTHPNKNVTLTDEQYAAIQNKFKDETPDKTEIDTIMIAKNLNASQVIKALNELDEGATHLEILAKINSLEAETTIQEDVNDEIDSLLASVNQEIINISSISNNAFTMVNGLAELEKANLEIEKNEALIQKTELTTGKELEKAKEQLEEAKVQLDQAQESINSIPAVTLYSLTHNENYGTVSYSNDSGAIQSISYVVPIVFFAVAALVTLTTMTRMVEEQRGQSGILRALGYTKVDVLMYYVKYVVLATVPATILGILFGTYSLAFIIYYLYTTLLYSVTNAPTHFVFGLDITALSFFISVGLTLLITMFVALKELNTNTATLMRPKTMKAGKRVLMENIPLIWKRLTFNQKVTVRNVFRNKKRAAMSIIGIMGCSALLVMGVGIKQSISKILTLQFDKLWSYDVIITLQDDYSYSESIKIEEEVARKTNISQTIISYVASGYTSTNKKSDNSTNMVVVNERNNDLIHFYRANQTKKSLVLDDDGVFMYQKTAEDLGLEKGDSFTFTLDNQVYTMKVSEVIEGYTQNYIYMSTAYYEKVIGKDITFNTIYTTMKDNDSSLEDSLKTSLLKNENILTVDFTANQHTQFTDMLQSLNYIILIITVAAALLAFVVLYNLTNINIQERVSEIATLKVLGFYPKETYDYIFKENTLLGIIGTFLGLFLGTYLHRFIILLVETEAVMFKRELNYLPYLFSIVVSLFFIEMINIIMRKVVNQVKMVESLKSVE